MIKGAREPRRIETARRACASARRRSMPRLGYGLPGRQRTGILPAEKVDGVRDLGRRAERQRPRGGRSWVDHMARASSTGQAAGRRHRRPLHLNLVPLLETISKTRSRLSHPSRPPILKTVVTPRPPQKGTEDAGAGDQNSAVLPLNGLGAVQTRVEGIVSSANDGARIVVRDAYRLAPNSSSGPYLCVSPAATAHGSRRALSHVLAHSCRLDRRALRTVACGCASAEGHEVNL